MPRPPSDIPDRIVRAALDHFDRRGVDAASLRAIARAAGTSAGMITYHFGTKDQLFFAVVDAYYSPFIASMEAIAAAHDDPLERLVALVHRLGSLRPDERRVALIVIREVTFHSPRVPPLLPLFFQGHVRLVAEALTAAMASGQVRQIPIFEAIPSVVAPFIVPQLLGLPDLFGIGAEAMATRSAAVLLDGLRVRESDAVEGG